jgi:hypothetical protein
LLWAVRPIEATIGREHSRPFHSAQESVNTRNAAYFRKYLKRLSKAIRPILQILWARGAKWDWNHIQPGRYLFPFPPPLDLQSLSVKV